MNDVPAGAIRSSAKFARNLAKASCHTEALSDCVHCNLVFLASWAEKLLTEFETQQSKSKE